MSKTSLLESENSGLRTDGRKYVTLAHKLVRKIARDALQPGDLLSTENSLVDEYGLSRVTIRKALTLLESEGLIERKQRKGTIVKQAINLKEDPHRFCGTVVIGIPHERDLNPQSDMALFATFTSIIGELDNNGFTNQIIRLSNDTEDNRQKFQKIVKNTQDLEGFCIIGFDPSPYKHYLQDFPVVATGTYRPVSAPWVGIDLAQITLESIRYLLDCGHRNIKMLCGPWVENTSFGEFVKGYRQALEEKSLPFHRDMVFMAYEGEDLTELAVSLLQNDPKPTAVYADDWRSTQAVVNAAQQLELNIPKDVSLISVGQNVTYLHSVSIATYLVDNVKIGKKVAQMIMQLVDNHELAETQVWVPGHILKSDSVRCLND